MGSDTQQIAVPAELDGVRYDKALAVMADISRSRARKMIESGDAGWVDGAVASARQSVVGGQVAWFRLVDYDGPHPEPVRFGVKFEDEHLVVIDKPAGVVTHPGPGHDTGTLVSGLIYRWPEIRQAGEHPRWGIVHRLDRETSGLIVVAKTQPAHEGLSAALRKRDVSRRYLSLVHGEVTAATGTIDAPIERIRSRRLVGVDGRPSITHYRRLVAWGSPELTLLGLTLETGRTHQIRVHLESIERFVVGDRVYGRPAPGDIDPGRVWLHATQLTFTHPTTGETVDVHAPLPADLTASLAALGPPLTGQIPQDRST